jgi:hypothetical protein
MRESTRIVFRNAFFGITFAMLTGGACASGSPVQKQEYVYADDLPVWTGDDKSLEFLSTSPPRTQSQAKQRIPRFWFGREHMPPAGLLPDGWAVDPPSADGRANWFSDGVINFTLRNPRTGKAATWAIHEPRVKVIFKESGQPAGISGAYLLNERYMAFSVTDGSFVFFDRSKGEFFPKAVKASRRTPEEACRNEPVNFVFICQGDMVALFLSPQGDVVVSGRGGKPRYAPLSRQ